MKTYYEKVDMRSRQALVAFLSSHGRYWTMNSWNRATSYANCVKIHRLGLTQEQLSKTWDLLDVSEVYDRIHDVLNEWAASHEWRWQVGFNGRSSGYLVLYQGALDWKNARTAQCDECGKLTWHDKNTPCTSARCEGTLRPLPEPRPQIVTYPGRGLDESEDFGDWSLADLRSRVRVIQEFDCVCDRALDIFVDCCTNCQIVEQTIMLPKTVKLLEPV